MQGGALAPAANMTLKEATTACQVNRRCFGWTASVPFNSLACSAQGPGGTNDTALLLTDVLFKDAWGARRVTKDASFTSWVLLHRDE